MIKMRTERMTKELGLNEEQSAKLLELNQKYPTAMFRGHGGPGGPGRPGMERPRRGNKKDGGERQELTEEQKKERPKVFQIVVDRVIVRENSRTRIAEAVDATLKLTHHKVALLTENGVAEYSTVPHCKDHKEAEAPVLHERMFSPYSREGACP